MPEPTTTVVVPVGLEGDSVLAACSTITRARLVCIERDEGAAPAGQVPNVVTAVPQEGQTVAVGSRVEVDYRGTGVSLTVPRWTRGEDPQTYCDGADQMGFDCIPNDLKQGNPAGQVISTAPAPGAIVAYGSRLAANYYSTSAPITVPIPQAGETPSAYCARADNLGFNCSARNQHLGNQSTP